MSTMTGKALEELNAFCVRFLNAKQSIGIAKKQQGEAKAEIADRVPTGDKTQRTVTLLDGSKLVVKRGFNTVVNVGCIAALFTSDPDFAGFHAPIKEETVRSLDTKGYEWYRINHPALFVKIAEHVALKPKEIGITVTPRGKNG